MNIEALALLETPTARKLVATWPKAQGLTKWQRVKDWSNISGIHPSIVWRWHEVLMRNEVIKEDGTIADLASEYISTIALTRAKVAKSNGNDRNRSRQ